ncbi:thiamine-phosphate kinase [Alicyclobacillus fastidiosus]|uniref:Thiamine-monophosphate kinase n=1 Tax=Alicyclobacillus fastidiosus TaxID=392011 RepID=A0ABY6ZFZ8_9BACL|nr:thiamine-phosphate kinase [Alicyclobacillus fastidiosus]WAH41665.1 thiamine-phosphate kinase [Alicyclobacillus fastidiosus]GMA63343.1 thiamine-monophosphate kinase [Alicyclobacillus fastidiosus]
MDEFGLIAALAKRLPKPGEDVLLGIGDDAAVFRTSTAPFVVTTDTMVEGVHFLPTTITDYNLGYKALAVSVSDVAAMGGRPRFAVVSLAIPAAWDKARLEQVYDGLRENTERFGCDVIGGDVVSTSGPLVITTTVIGEAENPIPRSGAKPGDILFVTGNLGGSSAGLQVMQEVTPASGIAQARLVERHQRPEPRVGIGTLCAKFGVHALNDVSDGLASELHEISAASGVRCVIEADQVPLMPEVKELARGLHRDALDYALYGGEDFELVGAASTRAFASLLATASAMQVPVTRIGRCDAGDGVVMRRPNGHLEVLEPKGYNHFKRVDTRSGRA